MDLNITLRLTPSIHREMTDEGNEDGSASAGHWQGGRDTDTTERT